MGKKAEVRVGAHITEFQKKMASVQREFAATGRALSAVSNNIRNSISLPFAAAGIAGVTFATQFENELLKINTLVGISGEQFTDLKKSIEQVSRATGETKEAMAQAAFAITSAGLRGKEAQDLLAQSAKATAIGLGDQQELARAGTAAMQVYGSKVVGAARSMDIMTAIVREGNLEAAELAPTIGKVLAIAGPLGVSFEEVGANIAVFTRLGLSAAETVTSLRSVLNSMLKPTQEAADELATYGLTFEDLRNKIRSEGLASVLQQMLAMTNGNVESLGRMIPSVEALANVLGTAGAQGEAYGQVLDNIKNSAGLVDAGFQTYAKGGLYNYKTALNSIKDAGIELGNALAPLVQQLGDVVRNVAGAFRALSEEQKMTVIQVAAFAAAIPLVLTPLASLVSMLGTVVSTLSKVGVALMAGSPITLGLAGMAVTLGVVIVYFDEFKNAVGSISTGFADWYNHAIGLRQALATMAYQFPAFGIMAMGVAKDVVQALGQMWQAAKRFAMLDFSGSWQEIQKGFTGSDQVWEQVAKDQQKLWNNIEGFFLQTLTPIKPDDVQAVADKLTAPFQELKDLWSNLFGTTTSTAALQSISAPIKEVSAAMFELGDHSKRVATEFSAALSKMRSSLVEIQEPLAGTAAYAQQIFSDLADSISENMSNMLSNIAGDLVMAFGYLAAGGDDIGGLFDNLLQQIAGFLEQLGKSAIAAGMAAQGIKLAFASPFATIAAGIAALALAGGMRAIATNRKNNQGNGLRPFADGGIVYGPTAALVGEYAGAANNPEVIAPLDKLRGLMQQGGSHELYGRLRGQDLFISTDRYAINKNRITG